MNRHTSIKFLVVAILVVVVFAGSLFWFKPLSGSTETPSEVIALQAPSLILEAHAEGSSPSANFLEEEAGISAYMKSPYSINLNTVRGLFRTIEDETSDYIIGSMAVEDNPEEEDVHVYIHRNGWIVAYYLEDDPVGKIPNWPKYHKNNRASFTTKLEDVVAHIAGEASLPYSGVTYYHFHYPHATKMMIIIEDSHSQHDSFVVNLTSTYNFYERSWSVYRAKYSLNGATIATSYHQQNYGTFSATQLPPDQNHEIEVYGNDWGHGALVLVYWRP